jgi:hypothetical protein
MKLFRVAEENLAPSWIANNNAMSAYDKNISISKDEATRINTASSENITEEIISKECEEIEKCASSNKIYHYNSKWNSKVISHLKEYASAIGLDKGKIIGIDATDMLSDINQIEKKASESNKICRTASKLVLEDPFHLEKLSDVSHMDKEDWQTISKQSNLKDAPQMTVGVKPLRGGEDYLKSSEPKVAKNQNTISNPNAIKSLFESKDIDNGTRLKLEKAEREANKIKDHADWEKNIISAMEKKDIIPRGKVFPTEVMNAQSGLQTPSSKMGVYAKFDKNSIPDKTEGEKIKESRKEWNDAMKRVAKEKQSFEMNRQEERGISDTFGDELKKAFKK